MGSNSNQTFSGSIYGNTTTSNPYVTSRTNNSGTRSSFNNGTAFDTINNYVNSNIYSLLDQYLNPTLNSVTNQAKMNSFINNLNSNSVKALENNIINPLSRRNMVRSSQATNLYNSLARENVNQISNYSNELLANSQKETAAVIANLLNYYLSGYNVLSDTQHQSLQTSQGNAFGFGQQNNNSSSNYNMANLAARMALQTFGVL